MSDTYIKMSTRCSFDAKVVAAGNAAFGALVRMAAWSGDHLTDGQVPLEVAKAMATDEELAALERVGLVTPSVTRDGRVTVVIPAFLKWNRSKAEVEAEKAKARRRKDRQRSKSADARNVTRDSMRDGRRTDAGRHASVTPPDPDPDPDRSLPEEVVATDLEPPRATPRPEPPPPPRGRCSNDGAEALLAAIEAAPSLRPIVDPARLAEQLYAAQVMAKGDHVEWLVRAIARADDDIATEEAGGGTLSPGTLAKIVRSRCQQARRWERENAGREADERPPEDTRAAIRQQLRERQGTTGKVGLSGATAALRAITGGKLSA